MRDLATFLRARRSEIISVWEAAARDLPSARGVSHERLVDFLPGLLDRIASHLEQLASGVDLEMPREPAAKHARDRLEDQYSLTDMVEELTLLRAAITELWGADAEQKVLNRALDQSIRASVEEFTSVRAKLAKKHEARLQYLATAGALVSSTLDFQGTLDHVAQMVVPEFADWCAVDLLRPDGTLGDFAAVAHRKPEKIQQVRDLRRRFPPDMHSNAGVPLVIRTKQPLLIDRVGDDQHPELRGMGVRSTIVVPLISRDAAFGALVLASAESGRRFTGDDLAFTEELARRAAAAIDNARLYEETRRAVELRDRILAVVSHDLRNPLGAIDLGAALLLKNAAIRSDPISRKQAETIQRSAGRMDRLISDLLDMSSIQAGRLSLQRDRCHLEPILAEAADAHEATAREKGIEIVREIRLGQDTVHCDHDRVLQVLSNLLGNAIKFCRGGDTVTLAADVRDHEVLVSVTDTGPGIGREELSRVFELYWQGKAREHRGTGLGLFISRGIIEAHGGRLWVESSVGTGSKFFLTLPLTV